MSKIQGNISEVFASIQGEGLHVGTMKLFIRMSGCNLRCKNCDVKEHLTVEDSFTLRPWPGQRLIRLPNPITPEKLFQKINANFPVKDFTAISFTGGEPLYQAEFIKKMVPIFADAEVPVFIETNGTLHREFDLFKDLNVFWSVDLKLSKNWGLNGKLLKKHKLFLGKLDPKYAYIRIILDTDDDPDQIIESISNLDLKNFKMVIQPFSKAPSHVSDWDTSTILEWIKLFRPYFLEVRWIPQVHKLLRIP
jgi:organic radical activating enzyme